MKAKTKYFRGISILSLVMMLTFNNNVNALETYSLKTNTELIVNSTKFTAIAGASFWDWIAGFFGKNKKKEPRTISSNRDRNQRGNSGNQIRGNKKGNTDSVPLDGGLGILVLGVAAYGVKKLRITKG